MQMLLSYDIWIFFPGCRAEPMDATRPNKYSPAPTKEYYGRRIIFLWKYEYKPEKKGRINFLCGDAE